MKIMGKWRNEEMEPSM